VVAPALVGVFIGHALLQQGYSFPQTLGVPNTVVLVGCILVTAALALVALRKKGWPPTDRRDDMK
jgi:CBS-domain-containing membrane protein